MTDPGHGANRAAEPPRSRRGLRPGWVGVLVVMAAVVLAAEGGARILEPHLPSETGSEQRAVLKAAQMRDRGHTEIVVLGSSEAAAGIDPEVLLAEIPAFTSAYNAGLVGSHLSATDRWFRRIVEPELTPDVVIVGVLPLAILSYDDVRDEEAFGTDDDGADAWLRETKRTFVETSRVYEATIDRLAPGLLGEPGRWVGDRSALVRSRTHLRSPGELARAVRNLVGGDREETEDLMSDIGPTGQNLEYSGPGDEERIENEVDLYRAAMHQPLDLESLDSLVDAIRSSGAEPILALAPIDRVSLRRDGLDLDGWDAQLDELHRWAADRGVPLHDSFTVDHPEAEFHDRHHLARAGAVRWSTELGRFVDQLCEDGRLRAC